MLAATLLAALALTLAVALGAGSPAAAADQTSQVTLRIGWLEAPDNLNPFVGIQGSDYELWHLNYDFLVGFNAKDLSPRPEIATKWEPVNGGKSWIFTIRKGMKWQDGQPVTAKDVAFTFNYIRDNELANLAIYTDGIVNATAQGDYSVRVDCDTPKANILRMVVPILPEHIWSKIPGKVAGSTYANKPPIIGSGPFKIVEWKKGRYVKLVANPTYWGGKPKVDVLIFQEYTNPDTMASDLKLGNIDGAVNVPYAQFSNLAGTSGLTTNKGTSWQFTELGMNCYDSPDSQGNPVLLDKRFRQALNWAVDRTKVVSTAFNTYAELGATIIVPYSQFHWQPPAEQTYTYDPATAKQILDEAGYKDVDGDGYREDLNGKPIDLRFMVTTDSPENQVASKLCVGWFKDIGIKTNLSVVDPGVLTDAQYNYEGDKFAPNYDLFMWYWTQDVDPNFMVGIYTPGQIEGWNDVCWTDPEYTKLNEQQSTEIDDAKRIPIVQQMQQIFYDAAPYVIFTYPYQLEAFNTAKWDGWVHAPAGSGSVIYNYNCIDTYTHVAPKATAAASGGLGGGAIAGIIVAAVVVVGAIAVFVVVRRRNGSRAEEV